MKTTTLFITYDGLLDPLGGSQILPYLYSIAKHPRPLHILSFEKPERYSAGAELLRTQLMERNINWTPLSFTTRFGKLGKLWDLLRMYGTALGLQWRYKFGIIHCRSYQAMQVGCLLHKLTGVRTLFDMRGLWVDERVDGGLWQQDRWLNRLAYYLYKKIEKRLLMCASHIIVLTNQVVPELSRLAPDLKASVSVIPCCADFNHFVPPAVDTRLALRTEMGVEPNALLITYLGSLGTWYLLEDMLRFFIAAQNQWGKVHLLLITRDWKDEHEVLINDIGLGSLRHLIHVQSATRDQVPDLLSASDVMLSFIKPAYSKIASSPTKLAEAFALGIPVISNTGIGDVDQITCDLNAGTVFDLNNKIGMSRVINELNEICQRGGQALRDRTRPHFGLEVAVHQYSEVYASIEETL